jgi:NADH-quinone oxidoreductase subunit A
MTPETLVTFVAVFVSVGGLFLLGNLLLGKLIRPNRPSPEKGDIYECGEKPVGTAWVQFDLRFYVVALLFIIFDVEVAFFFPWAAVFGKATNLADEQFAVVTRAESGAVELTPQARWMYQEFGVRNPTAPTTVPASLATHVGPGDDLARSSATIHAGARQLAWLTIVDIAAFFAVLMIGFAYVWKRGDLDWVRAVSQERALAEPRPHSDDPLEQEQFLSA